MSNSRNSAPSSRFIDVTSLLLIAVLVLPLIFTHKTAVPRTRDILAYDHYANLNLARHVAQNGVPPLWRKFDFAPVGRPNLYPPSIHYVLAALSLVTPSWTDALYALRIIALLGGLLCVWGLTRLWFGSLAALFAMGLLVHQWDATAALYGAFAAWLLFLSVPVLLWSVAQRRFLLSCASLVFTLYLHLMLPVLVCLGLGLFALRRREYLSFILTVGAVSLLLYLPWMLHILRYRDWMGGLPAQGFDLTGIMRRSPDGVSFYPIAVGLALVGWFIPRPHHAVGRDAIRYQLLAGLPLVLIYPHRFFLHGAVWIACLGGLGLASLLQWTRVPARGLLGIAATTLLIFLPTLHLTMRQVDGRSGPAGVEAKAQPGISSIWIESLLGRELPYVPYTGEDTREAGLVLADLLAEHEIVHGVDRFDTLSLAFFADRPADLGDFHEVATMEMLREVRRFAGQDVNGMFVGRHLHELPLDSVVERRVGRFRLARRPPDGPRAECWHDFKAAGLASAVILRDLGHRLEPEQYVDQPPSLRLSASVAARPTTVFLEHPVPGEADGIEFWLFTRVPLRLRVGHSSGKETIHSVQIMEDQPDGYFWKRYVARTENMKRTRPRDLRVPLPDRPGVFLQFLPYRWERTDGVPRRSEDVGADILLDEVRLLKLAPAPAHEQDERPPANGKRRNP